MLLFCYSAFAGASVCLHAATAPQIPGCQNRIVGRPKHLNLPGTWTAEDDGNLRPLSLRIAGTLP